MGALNALLQVTPEVLNSIHGFTVRANVLSPALVHAHILVALLVQAVIGLQLVGVNGSVFFDIGFDNWM